MPKPKRLHNAPRMPDFEGLMRDGDWMTDAWFLKPQYNDELSQIGWSRSERIKAKKGLEFLYPPEVVRELDVPWEGGLLLPLFDKWKIFPHNVSSLLRAGRDAFEVLDHLPAATDLVAKLRQRDSFHAAAFELLTWANLKRGGYTFEKVPETSSSRTPDFRVRLRGNWYALDCKALDASDADDVEADWEDFLHHGMDYFFVERTICVVEATGEYVGLIQSDASRDRLRREKQAIQAAFTSAAKLAKERGIYPCTVPVPPYGRLVFEPSPEGYCACENRFLGELTDEQQAVRARRLVRKGVKQLGGEAMPLIVMVAVGRRLPRGVLFQLVKEDYLGDQRFYDKCAFLFFVGYVENTRGDRIATPAVLGTHAENANWAMPFARDVSKCTYRNPWPEDGWRHRFRAR